VVLTQTVGLFLRWQVGPEFVQPSSFPTSYYPPRNCPFRLTMWRETTLAPAPCRGFLDLLQSADSYLAYRPVEMFPEHLRSRLPEGSEREHAHI
jgi:hypothetical protein